MENLCNKEMDEYIIELIKSIMKYDTYWYRSIIVAPLGDGFPWWKVKNNRLDGLMSSFDCAMKSSFTGSRNCTKGSCKIYTLFLS